MIIYPATYDWILAGDVYMAALIENEQNPKLVKVVEVDFSGGLIMPISGINEESRISIIGHGSPGTYNHIISSGFINILHEMGLDKNYKGTIEYFTCDSALFNEENPHHSLAHLTKNEFPLAKIIGAKGPSIIGYDKCRYIVNPLFCNNASTLQDSILRPEHDFNQILAQHNHIIDKGKAVRENNDVKAFYGDFIQQLKEKNYLINGLSYLV